MIRRYFALEANLQATRIFYTFAACQLGAHFSWALREMSKNPPVLPKVIQALPFFASWSMTAYLMLGTVVASAIAALSPRWKIVRVVLALIYSYAAFVECIWRGLNLEYIALAVSFWIFALSAISDREIPERKIDVFSLIQALLCCIIFFDGYHDDMLALRLLLASEMAFAFVAFAFTLFKVRNAPNVSETIICIFGIDYFVRGQTREGVVCLIMSLWFIGRIRGSHFFPNGASLREFRRQMQVFRKALQDALSI